MKAENKNDEVLKAIKQLTERVNDISNKDNDDLESEFEHDDEKKKSQMLEIDPTTTDSFGDSIELVTKSRLKDYNESFQIARNFVEREYHNMVGNRYGRHSKIIPVFDDNGKPTKIDMTWFSGNDVKIISTTDKQGNERLYYKVRLLVYDILTKKLLLSRIPTSDGAARQEEIQHIGAGRLGKEWIDQNAPMQPMKPIKYTPNKPNTKDRVGAIVNE